MSTRNPIPARLRDKFIAHMVAHDCDDMPDGAWFYTLEQAAEQFMRQHKLPGDCNDAAHQYLRITGNGSAV